MSPQTWFFDTSNLTPHGFCLTWEPWLLWLDAAADAAIALAYFSIPLALFWFAHTRRDLPHKWLPLLFAAFIVACGTTHVMDIVTLWVPAYNLELAAKLLTASLSLVTAVVLWPLIPKLLAIPSASQMHRLNGQLHAAIADEQRISAELAETAGNLSQAREALQEQNALLERRVIERTAELTLLNDIVSRKEAHFRTVVRAAPNAMVMVDHAGVISMVNEEAETIFGYQGAEMLGQAVEMLLPKRFRAKHPGLRGSYARDVPAHTARPRQALFARRKDGTEFEVEIGLNPIETDQGPMVLSAVVDISERVRLTARLSGALDQAEQANRAKSRFLAGISHEIRTPLNGVLGYAHLMKMEGGLTFKQDGRIDSMIQAGQHLLETINSVLDLSAIEADRFDLHPTEIDLRHVTERCLDMIRPAADGKALTLELVFDGSLPRRVIADRARLGQILTNLLGNAVKFTPAGSVQLRVGQGISADSARFDVVDTGPGIPADQRDRIFREFERLDTHVLASVEGSGLGLPHAARLAVAMGGHLRYEDNPHGGSTFCVELPIRPAPAGGLSDEADQAGPHQEADVLRVLVVDDVAMNRDIAGSFLQAAGHDVVFASDGAQAVAAVTAEAFDVVLMDVRMPVVDGLEATRRIRALPSPSRQVPIIGLTAQAFAEQIQECWNAGMDCHLSKPYTQSDLLASIGRSAELAARRQAVPG